MNREELESAIAAGAVIIDVRPVDEFVREHLANSVFIRLNRQTFPAVLRACVSPGSPVVLVVASEGAGEAAKKLVTAGGEYRMVGTIFTEVGGIRSMGCPTESVGVIGVTELAARIARPERDLRLVDVREPFEWKLGYIEGSTLISLKDVRAASRQWKRSGAEVICICEEGFRSTSAASLLKRDGVRGVKSVKGGIAEWFSSGRPLKEA